MSIAGFPTSSDIYLEVDGVKVAVVQSYSAKASKTSSAVEAFGESEPVATVPGQTSHVLELTRLYATDEAIRDGIDFYGLSGFSLVICKPDRKIIYSDCQWSSISEAGADRMELENGMELRLLSALEVLEARREAAQLAESQGERALCSNACLLARALESGEKPVFDSGRAVLAGLTVSEIAALAGRWREFDRKENPSAAGTAEELENVKKN